MKYKPIFDWLKSHKTFCIALVLLLLAATWVVHRAQRPMPDIKPTASSAILYASCSAKDAMPDMQWSPYGEQAIAVVGSNTLAANSGQNNPKPMASIAKVMTALVLLQEKPLKIGEQGSAMTITDADVAVYQREFDQNQSVVPVETGEKMTEYQITEAMLVPSATNIADSAAVWAFGSIPNYLAKANQLAASLGMTDSHFADDASGFSPASYSTPQDLIKLGSAAIQNPVIAEIVGKTSVDLPVAGTVQNFNIALGQLDINGIKTGNTDEAGGTFLFSAPFEGHTIVGAMMGAPDLGTALHDSPSVLGIFESTLCNNELVKPGQKLGIYTTPWGKQIDAIAKSSLSHLEWKDSKTPITVSLLPIAADAKTGQQVGSASIQSEGQTTQTPVILQGSSSSPSLWWRIWHN